MSKNRNKKLTVSKKNNLFYYHQVCKFLQGQVWCWKVTYMSKICPWQLFNAFVDMQLLWCRHWISYLRKTTQQHRHVKGYKGVVNHFSLNSHMDLLINRKIGKEQPPLGHDQQNKPISSHSSLDLSMYI